MEVIHSFPILSTKHLALTALVDEDVGAISLLRSDERVNKYIDRPKNCSIEDAQAFIQKIIIYIKKGFIGPYVCIIILN